AADLEPPPLPHRRRPSFLDGARIRTSTILKLERSDHRFSWLSSLTLRFSTPPSCGGLELPSLARLHVVPSASQFTQDSGLHDLLLECLESPVDLVAFVK